MIYESPDGGNTVYSRQPGQLDRVLIHQSDEVRLAKRWINLEKIVKLADSEPSLNDALEKVEMLYNLIKDNERD